MPLFIFKFIMLFLHQPGVVHKNKKFHFIHIMLVSFIGASIAEQDCI